MLLNEYLQNSQHIGFSNGYYEDFGPNPVGKQFAIEDF